MKPLCCDNINVGLELEYEGVSYPSVRDSLRKLGDNCWHATHDGSLRPADKNTELKFDGPLQGKLIHKALDNLSVLDKYLPVISPSWRCGMHVHIDYTGVDYVHAHNTLILGAILEPLLFAWAGPARVESKFCSPTTQLVHGFINKGGLLKARKYSAINLASLQERNTVEFRYADTTVDREMMLDYINVNMALRMASEKFDSGWAILDSVLSAESLDAWLQEHMHPLAHEILVPFAMELANRMPWKDIAPAIVALAEHQETMPQYIIGNRRMGRNPADFLVRRF